ncbi:MAG: hypothetical protein QOG65_2097 [Actinomycetota bacterium]|nr:hypothetical protein [Actinomycetota bacterium]
MPGLSRAADHSVLWLAIAAALGGFGGRRSRRAALRGVIAIAGSSAIASGVLERLPPRVRPPLEPFPFVGLRRRPISSSMPSGHAASAAAFATAASMELPLVGAALGALAAAVAYSRVYNGVHSPGEVVLGGAIGAGVAAATVKVWPRADYSPASARPVPVSLARVVGVPSADGAGLTNAVKPGAHTGPPRVLTDELRAVLPEARIVMPDTAAGIEPALREAVARGEAIGIVGGDGSVNAAAGIAVEYDCPLLVVPGGTLNHFARDLGLESVDDAARALKRGQLVAVDVGLIDRHVFVNTASFGSYSKLVEAREELESSIGKWAALGVALVRVLRENDPFEVMIDGRTRRIWMIFVGNCAYEPPGFAPTTRTRLDDGLFDVRIVDGSAPWARVRLILAALTGNLVRSRIYTRALVPALTCHVPESENPLAADGEVFDGKLDFTIEKHAKPLLVYAPK